MVGADVSIPLAWSRVQVPADVLGARHRPLLLLLDVGGSPPRPDLEAHGRLIHDSVLDPLQPVVEKGRVLLRRRSRIALGEPVLPEIELLVRGWSVQVGLAAAQLVKVGRVGRHRDGPQRHRHLTQVGTHEDLSPRTEDR